VRRPATAATAVRAVAHVGGGDLDDVGRLGVLEDHVRGHHLGEAGDGHALGGLLVVVDPPGLRVDEDGGPAQDGGRVGRDEFGVRGGRGGHGYGGRGGGGGHGDGAGGEGGGEEGTGQAVPGVRGHEGFAPWFMPPAGVKRARDAPGRAGGPGGDERRTPVTLKGSNQA
jgi:hypothetical protein